MFLIILNAVILPSCGFGHSRYQIDSARRELARFERALDAFQVDIGRYPSSRNGLKELINAPANGVGKGRVSYLREDTEIPKDPWGNDYVYQCPGVHNTNSYDLFSIGPDHKIGGGDDITNWQKK